MPIAWPVTRRQSAIRGAECGQPGEARRAALFESPVGDVVAQGVERDEKDL